MIYFLLCLYAYKHGQTNAFLYSLKGANSLERNEHVDLVMERAISVLVGLASFGYGFALGWDGAGVYLTELLASVLAFSFWHNGAYYVMRAKIANREVYDWDEDFWPAWTHQSKSTTARFDFTYRQRLIMKLSSIAVLIGGYLLL